MSTTIGDTRKIADQLADQITVRANTLKANATKSLLLTSIVTLLLLVLLILTALARPLRKPVQMAHPSVGGRLSGVSAWSGGREATK